MFSFCLSLVVAVATSFIRSGSGPTTVISYYLLISLHLSQPCRTKVYGKKSYSSWNNKSCVGSTAGGHWHKPPEMHVNTHEAMLHVQAAWLKPSQLAGMTESCHLCGTTSTITRNTQHAAVAKHSPLHSQKWQKPTPCSWKTIKSKGAASVNVSVGLNSNKKKFIQSWFSFSLLEMSQGKVVFDVTLLYLVWCWHFLCGWTLLLFACCCHDNSVSSSSLRFPALCLVSCRKLKTLCCLMEKLATLLHPFFGKWRVSSEERGGKKKPWCTFVRKER